MAQSALERLKKANPVIGSREEAIAAFIHCQFLSLGFRNAKDPADEFFEGWNASPSVYEFEYKHSQSSMKFIIKILPIGNKILVNGLADGADKVSIVEFKLDDVSNKDAPMKDAWDRLLVNPAQLYDHIKTLINHLAPGLIEPEPTAETGRTVQNQIDRNNERTGRYHPYPDYPDDPLRIGPVQRPRPNFNPYPGIADPLHPDSRLGYPGSGDLVGPDHPMFGGLQGPPFGGNRPELPRGAVPPGARFDPFGPGPTGRYPGPNPDHLRPPDNWYG